MSPVMASAARDLHCLSDATRVALAVTAGAAAGVAGYSGANRLLGDKTAGDGPELALGIGLACLGVASSIAGFRALDTMSRLKGVGGSLGVSTATTGLALGGLSAIVVRIATEDDAQSAANDRRREEAEAEATNQRRENEAKGIGVISASATAPPGGTVPESIMELLPEEHYLARSSHHESDNGTVTDTYATVSRVVAMYSSEEDALRAMLDDPGVNGVVAARDGYALVDIGGAEEEPGWSSTDIGIADVGEGDPVSTTVGRLCAIENSNAEAYEAVDGKLRLITRVDEA